MQYLSGLETVTDAAATSGAYDVIATVQAASDDALRPGGRGGPPHAGLCVLRLCRPG